VVSHISRDGAAQDMGHPAPGHVALVSRPAVLAASAPPDVACGSGDPQDSRPGGRRYLVTFSWGPSSSKAMQENAKRRTAEDQPSRVDPVTQ